LIIVGDKAMVTDKAIVELKKYKSVDWISALRSASISELIEKGRIEHGLFDDYGFIEIEDPDKYPGERLVLCRNPCLQDKRMKSRDDLIESTKEKLKKIEERVNTGRLKNKDAIALAVGRVIDKNKVKKYFNLDFADTKFKFTVNKIRLALDQKLDGIYIIRTSLSKSEMSSDDCVRQYKNLTQVERAFRTMKNLELRVRPIYHRLDDRIKSHLFLTMLSYYVEFFMRKVWSQLTFADPKLSQRKKFRHPVKPAVNSKRTYRKAITKYISKGSNIRVCSFDMIIDSLSSISEVQLVLKGLGPKKSDITIQRKPLYNPMQEKAYELLKLIPMFP
jgi:transposase